ncbi:hypothetical protein L3X38_011181 [Prunus dulcis]|uniref:Uncharacterized protein n=1 Tax=Prunus dulcis TaxID=3755 RepID=A0AAD4WH14_PRUDU|nr:hypothetical protein L3X38_011181 [Prunus dulcis]
MSLPFVFPRKGTTKCQDRRLDECDQPTQHKRMGLIGRRKRRRRRKRNLSKRIFLWGNLLPQIGAFIESTRYTQSVLQTDFFNPPKPSKQPWLKANALGAKPPQRRTPERPNPRCHHEVQLLPAICSNLPSLPAHSSSFPGRSSNVPGLPECSSSLPWFQRIPSASQQVPAVSHGCQRVPTASENFQQPPMAASAFQQPLVAAHAVQPPPAATQPLQTTAIATGTQQQLCHLAAKIAAQPHSPVASSVVQPQGLGTGAATHDSAAIRDHLNSISGNSLVFKLFFPIECLQMQSTRLDVGQKGHSYRHVSGRRPNRPL